MNVKRYLTVIALLISVSVCSAQNAFQFAFVTDTHVGNTTGADDLRRTVKDINANSSLSFVVVTGDITEFGADHELKLAKQILDSLNKKYYVIPGNHDANWSESGSNTFKTVFGAETFAFEFEGYLFAATSSGPNMRMGPGQIPRENVVWLDSVLRNMKNGQLPIIYMNHYPQTDDQNNWYEAINRLKKRNVQLILCGHGHNNHKYNFENIPGVMGRSNLRAKDSVGGYNIVTVRNGKAIFEERNPVVETQKQWLEVPLENHYFSKDTTKFPRPSYAVNSTNKGLKLLWEFQDRSDIGAGMATTNDALIAVNTSGDVYALNKRTGKVKWIFKSNGKIYSTPAVEDNYVVVGSSNHTIYGLNASTGKLLWEVKAEKAVVASPVIKDHIAYIGASDGHFRAIDIKNGKIIWDFDQVKGFVVTQPLIYENKIYFGCWANDFYALDLKTGKQVWKWNNGATNRMFSPAACYPVAANGRVFIVAPDRYMTSLNANTGEVIWRKQMKDVRARESMGLSKDSSLVYIKTMDGQLYGVSSKADSMDITWKSDLQLPYELAPSAIVENNDIVYVPSHSGTAYAVDRNSGAVLWQYKVSNSLVNTITPIDDKKAVVSTMDGKVACLEFTR